MLAVNINKYVLLGMITCMVSGSMSALDDGPATAAPRGGAGCGAGAGISDGPASAGGPAAKITSNAIIFSEALGRVVSGMVSVEQSIGKTEDFPLINAAKIGNVDSIRGFMKDSYFTIHVRDKNGWTALHWAVENNHLAVVRVLLASPLSWDESYSSKYYKRHLINLESRCKQTALHLAIRPDRAEIFQFLLANSACLDSRDCFGRTPLHYAAKRLLRDMAYALYQKGGLSLVTTQDRVGFTAYSSVLEELHKNSKPYVAATVDQKKQPWKFLCPTT